MTMRRNLMRATAAAALALTLAPVFAQGVIKIGEVNSYKAQPAFLEPYKKGMELAVDEINACLLYTSPSPRDVEESRMPSSA